MTRTTAARRAGIVATMALLLFSCEDFFGTEDLAQQIRDDVDEATAPVIDISISAPQKSSMGVPSPLGSQQFKVGVSYSITTTVGDDYTFLAWTCTGDAADYTFADATSATTTVTINREVDDLVITPTFDRRPYVTIWYPYSDAETFINKTIKITFNEPIDPETLSLQQEGSVQVTAITWLDQPDTLEHIEESLTIRTAENIIYLELKDGELFDKYHYITTTLSSSIKDLNGNSMADEFSWFWRTNNGADTSAPSIDEFTITNAIGVESAASATEVATNGDSIYLTVTASDEQTVPYLRVTETPCDSGGTPTGGSTQSEYSTLASGSPFAFTLAAASDGYTLIEVEVADISGNWTTITGDETDTKIVRRDTSSPTVSGVSSAKDAGFYTIGEVIDVAVAFTEAVTVTGAPRLLLELGATDAYATYNSGSGTASLTFRYTVAAGQNNPDLDYVATDSLGLNGGTIRDAAGNNATLTLASPGAAGSLALSESLAVDTIAPSMTVTMDDSSLNVTGASTTVHFDFSESVTGFASSDVTAPSGSLSGFAGSGAAYTATFTATAATTDATNAISVAAASYADAANNSGAAGASANYAVDTQAPSVTSIVLGTYTLNLGTTSTLVTFNFSEAVTGFDASDVTVGTGSISAVTGSGTTYSATLTADAGVEIYDAVVSVGTGYVDAAGNPGSTGTSAQYDADLVAPTVTITMSDYELNVLGNTATVTFEFSEDVTGFTLGDISSPSGSEGTLNGSEADYSFLFTATSNLEAGTNQIAVTAGGYFDAVNNPGASGASSNYEVDTKAPTVTVTMGASTFTGATTQTLVTFQFSETVTGFANADVVVDSGAIDTIAATDGDTYTATFTATGGIDVKNNTIDVTASTYMDSAGNPGSGDSSDNYIVDYVAPEIDSIVFSDNTLNVDGDETSITFTFSEAVTGFAVGDIDAPNGALSAFTGSGASYSVTFTATAGVEDDSNVITIDADSYTDGVGLTGGGDVSGNYEIDTLAPTVTVTLSAYSLNVLGNTATVTFQFSEDVTGFAAADISAQSGALSGFTTDDANTYRATLTAPATTEDAENVVSAAATYTDLAGNDGTADDSPNYTVDTKAPTVTVTMGASTFAGATTQTLVTFQFSETVTGFANADVVVDSGAIDTIAATDGDTYTATFTATGGIDVKNNTIDVTALQYTDSAGNPGSGDSSDNYVVDYVAPEISTIAIADDTLNVLGDETVITFTFSEDVTGFAVGDIDAPNGSLSGFSGSGASYSVTFTATAGVEDDSNVITIDADSYTDGVGLTGGGDVSGNYEVDTKAPTVEVTLSDYSLNVLGNTATVTFQFSEDVTGFAAADISAASGTLSGFTTDDANTYRATLTAPATTEDAENVVSAAATYTDLAGNDGTADDSDNYAVDTITPSPSITSPAANAYVNAAAAMTISADGGTLTAKLAGYSAVAYTSGTTAISSLDAAGWAAIAEGGDVAVTVYSTDSASNVGNVTRTFKKDTAVPTFTVTTRTYNDSTGVLTVEMNADTSSFSAIQYLVKNSTNWSGTVYTATSFGVSGSGPYTVVGTIANTLSNGDYFQYRVVDGAGNVSAVKQVDRSGSTYTSTSVVSRSTASARASTQAAASTAASSTSATRARARTAATADETASPSGGSWLAPKPIAAGTGSARSGSGAMPAASREYGKSPAAEAAVAAKAPTAGQPAETGAGASSAKPASADRADSAGASPARPAAAAAARDADGSAPEAQSSADLATLASYSAAASSSGASPSGGSPGGSPRPDRGDGGMPPAQAVLPAGASWKRDDAEGDGE